MSRFPSGTGLKELPIGKAEVLRSGKDVTLLVIGTTVYPSLHAAEILAEDGIECTVVNARFAKPLDSELILHLVAETKRLVTIEENALAGGFGSAVLQLVESSDLAEVRTQCIGLPDEFIEHGSQELLRAKFGLDAEGIAQRVKNFFTDLPVRLSVKSQEGITR